MPIPVRSAASNPDFHVADHNLYRDLYNLLNPATDLAYGLSTSNNAAQNATALQAAIDANAGYILIPKGTYQINPVTLSGNCGTILGAGADKTILVCPSGDLFTTFSAITGWRFIGFRAAAQNGDLFVGSYNACRWEDVDLNVSAADGHIIYHDSSDGLSSFLENLFINVRVTLTTSHSVPGFYLRGTNAVNLNQWIGGRYTYSGDYMFHLEGVSASSFLSNNSFRGINFEVTNGGNVRLLSCLGTRIDDCGTYDTGANDITKPLYSAQAGTGGLKCQYTTLIGNLRHGGVMGAGVDDIYAPNQLNTTLINNGSTVGDYSIDVSGSGLFAINDKQIGSSKIGMTSPDGTLWAVSVSDAGALSVSAV